MLSTLCPEYTGPDALTCRHCGRRYSPTDVPSCAITWAGDHPCEPREVDANGRCACAVCAADTENGIYRSAARGHRFGLCVCGRRPIQISNGQPRCAAHHAL